MNYLEEQLNSNKKEKPIQLNHRANSGVKDEEEEDQDVVVP